jgi:hypothetical protein
MTWEVFKTLIKVVLVWIVILAFMIGFAYYMIVYVDRNTR